MKLKLSLSLCLALLLALSLTGCGTAKFADVIRAAGESKAAVHFSIVAPQGTLVYDRAAPDGTNSITVGGTGGVTTH